jgi:hypothetical protein
LSAFRRSTHPGPDGWPGRSPMASISRGRDLRPARWPRDRATVRRFDVCMVRQYSDGIGPARRRESATTRQPTWRASLAMISLGARCLQRLAAPARPA